MRLLLIFLVITLKISFSVAQNGTIEIQLKNKDIKEVQTKDQLLKLLSLYDLKRYIFTSTIIIESGFHVVPHSHPVLTLNTRHLKDDDLLLSTLIHEQLHWFITEHPSKEKILVELKSLYPHPEIDFPEGSGGEIDTYFHIIICYLEYRALKEVLGELRAYHVINFWIQDHYRWIYKTVLSDQPNLNELVRKYSLTP